MAAVSAITTAIGIASSVIGTGTGIISSIEQSRRAESANEATQEAAAASARAERARQRQLELDSLRRRRRALRESIIAQGAGITSAANQGVSLESSPVQAGQQQITSQFFSEESAITQNEELGQQVFAANEDVAIARGRAQTEQNRGASTFSGRGLSSLGETLITNSERIGRIGGTIFG